MIIKEIADKSQDKNILQQLLRRPDLIQATRQKIEKKLKYLNSGTKGENNSAYQLDFYYGASEDWIVIHDLRLVFQHQIAQIDHLLINRFLQVFVCESKSVSGEIIINKQGEFSYKYETNTKEVASPLLQNQRHIAVLENIFRSGLITLPKRLGIRLQPSLESLILVTENTKIVRPQNQVAGIERIIKTDQVKAKVEEYTKKLQWLRLCKKISSSTLQNMGQQLCDLHRPAPTTDWYKHFGIYSSDEFKTEAAAGACHAPASTKATAEATLAEQSVCVGCGRNLTAAEKQFCHHHPMKFNVQAYCYPCQRTIAAKETRR